VIGTVCDLLNARGPELGLPPLRGGVVVGLDRHPSAKVTMLLFAEDGRLAAVAKTARQVGSEPALGAEHAALQALQDAALPTVGRHLPRPLLADRVRSRAVLVTSAVPGAPLSMRYYTPGHVQRPDAVDEDLRWAGAWLARFQQETWTGVTSVADAFDRWVQPAFDRYRRAMGWGAGEERLLDRLTMLAKDLGHLTIPLVAVHGDYAIGNVLVGGDGVSGVVDWERGERVGLPFTDLFKFIGSYGSFLDRAVPPKRGELRGHPGWATAHARWGAHGWSNLVGFLYAYAGEGWFPERVCAFLHEHLERIGVPPAATALFLPAFVADQVTVLEDEAYRKGYRALLCELAALTEAPWLRRLEVTW